MSILTPTPAGGSTRTTGHQPPPGACTTGPPRTVSKRRSQHGWPGSAPEMQEGTTMDASDSAAVVVAVASSVAVVVLLYAVASLTRSVREMRSVVRQFHDEAMPVVIEMRAAMDQANSELERVDSLLDTAESVTATVD